MKDDKKLEYSEILTMQAEQLNKFLDKIECTIPELVKNAPTDTKIKFYNKVNKMYNDKRTKLQETIKV